MRFIKAFAVILAPVLLLAGCGEDDRFQTNIEVGNPVGLLAITVADGQDPKKPSYFWYNINDNSDTTARTLTIERKDNPGVPVWSINTAGADLIDSGVLHGTAPPGSNETATVEPALQINIWYKIFIEKVDPVLNSSMEFRILP